MKIVLLIVMLAGAVSAEPDTHAGSDALKGYRDYFRYTLVFSDLYGEHGEFRMGGKVPGWYLIKEGLKKEAPEKLKYARYRTLAMVPALGLLGGSFYFLLKDDPDSKYWHSNIIISIGLETAAWGMIRFMHKMELMSKHALDQALRRKYLQAPVDTARAPEKLRQLAEWDLKRVRYTTCLRKHVMINEVPVGGWSAREETAACRGISIEAGHYFKKSFLYKKLAAGGFTAGIGLLLGTGISRTDNPYMILTALGGGLGASLLGKTWLGKHFKYQGRALKVYDRDLRDKLDVGYPELVKKEKKIAGRPAVQLQDDDAAQKL